MRTSTDSTYFAPPSRNSPSKRMWVIVALCVALPPVGLILLWSQARNPLRGKLIVSIIALLSMTLMITVYLSVTAANRYKLQMLPSGGSPLTGVAPTPTPAPDALPADPGAQQQGTSGAPAETPLPANPIR